MALKPTKNGEYHIANMKQAKEALVLFQAVKAEIESVREQYGLGEMEIDAVELKKAVSRWAIETDTERIDFDKGFHATLVKQSFDSQFIATDDEIPDDLPEGRKVVPLQRIIEKKFKGTIKEKGKARKVWMRITKRVVDRAMIDEIVSEGILSADDLKPAFVQREKAPYLRIFED
jgi:hypothetical protein